MIAIAQAVYDRAEELQRLGTALMDLLQRASNADRQPLAVAAEGSRRMSIATPPNGAVLWSYQSRNPSTGENISNKYVAQAWAQNVNRNSSGRCATIEMTPAG